MAVAVRNKPELAFSAPEPLMADDYGRPLGETHTSFDVTPDGHFVFTRPVSPDAQQAAGVRCAQLGARPPLVLEPRTRSPELPNYNHSLHKCL